MDYKKLMGKLNEEHLVHVNDGSNYGDKPHPKDVEHVMAGAKKHNGEHDGNSDKGAFFKFKSHSDAQAFKKHVDSSPHKSVYADLNEGLDIIARADYKLNKAGKKSHKEIVFHNGDGDQEKDDKLKREEVELDETAWGKDKMTNLRQAHDRHMEKAVAANKTGDNEAVKTHQRKMQMIKTQMQKHKQNEEIEIDEAAQGHTIEAQGIRGMKATPWRKTFKNNDHLSKWVDANDSVEVHGTRDLEQAKKGNLSPAMKEQTKEKKRMMGIAAYMAAKKTMKEEVKKDEPPFDGPYTSSFKKPNNPNRTGMDSARSLAQRALDQVKKKPVKEESHQPKTTMEDKPLTLFKKDKRTFHPPKEESHQSATTMKHIPNPSPALKKAAKDIKPGIAGYRDRIAMLKAGGVKEEVEQMDELSTSTLKSYISGAQKDRDSQTDSKNSGDREQAAYAKKQSVKRTLGIVDAKARLNKEEVEELDELSKTTLGSYAKKASRDAVITRKIGADFENQADKARSPGMKAASNELSQKYKSKSWKRRDGVDKAVDRLTKEETVVEAKDEQEYGYEGDMAMTQLETAIRHATHLKDMMEPDTDLPEWVQSKITLATDYLQTACDYMTSEMNEALKGNQHKIDKNKNGKVDSHDFKLLRKEEQDITEALDPSEVAGNPKMYDASTAKKAYYHNKATPQDKKTLERHLDQHHGMRDWRKTVKEDLDEAMINAREYASHGLMHPTHAGHAVHKVTGNTIDFYAHGSGDKVSGKVTKNDGKAVHIKDTSGKTHRFEVSTNLPKQQNEQAPVAPVPDRKYIKGTPENKALKAARKPINGMPTNVKEDANFDEEGNLMAQKKTYSQFVEQLLEYESDKDGVYRHTKGSYGKSYDSEDDDKPSKADPSAVKRGRGRPAGAKSGANQKVSSGKSYGGIATHTLNLPK